MTISPIIATQSPEVCATADNTSLVRLYLQSGSLVRQLHPLEFFYCTMFTRGALHFAGTIDINRFLSALKQTLQNFDVLFATLHVTNDGAYVHYSADKEHFVQLEIDQNATKSDLLLPENVDPRMLQGIGDDLEGLPMCALKLSIYKTGWCIGYHLNHALFDQASAVYLFTYLANCYSNNGKSSLAKPTLVALDALHPKKPLVFEDLQSHRSFGQKCGFSYVADKSEFYKRVTSAYPGVLAELKFPLSALTTLKNQSAQFISENDILHALLLKMYALDPTLSLEQELCFTFPCNMRKRCDLTESTIGNVVGSCALSLTVDSIRSADLVTLAAKNRTALNTTTAEGYKEYLMWYKSFPQFKQIAKDYLPTTFIRPHYFGASSWSTFPYENIRFDEETPTKLATPSVATLGISIICFEIQGNDKVLTTSVGFSKESIPHVLAFAKNCNLFTVTIN